MIRPEPIQPPGRHRPSSGQAKQDVVQPRQSVKRRAAIVCFDGEMLGDGAVGRIVETAPAVEIAAEHGGLAGPHGVQQASRLPHPRHRRKQPQPFRGCAIVEMRAGDAERPRLARGARAGDGGFDRDAALTLERQLDRRKIRQRQRRQDGVAAIFARLVRRSVAHRRGVVEGESERGGNRLDVESPTGWPARLQSRRRSHSRTDGVRHVATMAIRFLQQKHEVRHRPAVRQVAVAQVLHQRLDVAGADVYVPADDDERICRVRRIPVLDPGLRSHDRGANAAAPGVQIAAIAAIVRLDPGDGRRRAIRRHCGPACGGGRLGGDHVGRRRARAAEYGRDRHQADDKRETRTVHWTVGGEVRASPANPALPRITYFLPAALRRSSIRFIASFVLVLAFAAPVTAQPAFPQADEAVLQAYRLLHDSDHLGAQREFEHLVAARPQDLPARFGLVRVLDTRANLAPVMLPEFERHLDRFMVDVEARYGRNEHDAEAAFYLAHALVIRARYRVRHDKGMWAAARDGARAKRISEAYVKRHPGHVDGMLALGIYNYYVEIAPAFVRFIRTFLFLPSGNRAEGLQQMERVHTQGVLFRYDAGLILMEAYSTFEGRTADGLRIGERMTRDYPGNPQVHFELAQLYAGPAVEDLGRAAAEYKGVLAREEKRPGEPRPARYQARQGLASVRQQQWRIEDAIALLTAIIDRQPTDPVWVMPTFLLRRGNYRVLIGDPAAGADAQRVRADARWQSWHKDADEQLAWIKRWTGPETTVYTRLLAGNRFAADRRWDEAAAAYAAVARDHPGHPQVRYRIAHLRFQRGDHEGAAPEFAALSQLRDAPIWLKAQALLYLGRSHDLAGRRAEAVRTYQRVVDTYERENASFAARIGIITPYKRAM